METIKCNNCGKVNLQNRVLCIKCNTGLWCYMFKQTSKKSNEEKYNSKSELSINNEVYYGNVLELRGKITKADIKKQYYKIIAQYHPDKVSKMGKKIQKLAESESKIINEAYAYFKNIYNIT